MNDEQLTAEVKALELYLTDVWRWNDLARVGWNMNVLFLCREPGDRDQLEAEQGLDTELETLLVTSYGRAIAEIDRVLPTLPQGPVLTALLERLQSRVRAIGGHSFSYYIEREPQVNEGHFENETGTRPQAEVEQAFELHQQFTRDAWQCVESSLSEYLGRVADHIAAASARTMSEAPPTSQPLNRLKWECSQEVYVHLVRELMQRGYITLPGMNGKLGEGNVTEVFRRLSQAFILSKRDRTEMTAEALQRRYNDDKLPDHRRALLTLPEAKDVK